MKNEIVSTQVHKMLAEIGRTYGSYYHIADFLDEIGYSLEYECTKPLIDGLKKGIDNAFEKDKLTILKLYRKYQYRDLERKIGNGKSFEQLTLKDVLKYMNGTRGRDIVVSADGEIMDYYKSSHYDEGISDYVSGTEVFINFEKPLFKDQSISFIDYVLNY